MQYRVATVQRPQSKSEPSIRTGQMTEELIVKAFVLNRFSSGWFLPQGSRTSDCGHQKGKINDFTCDKDEHIGGQLMCVFSI